MAEYTTLARPYARAAFDYAQKHKVLKEWERSLQLLAAVSAEPAVAARLSTPLLSSEQRVQLLVKICGKELDEAMQRFLHRIAEKKRLPLLAAIAMLFSELKAQQEKQSRVKIFSAQPLDKALRTQLGSALQKSLGHEVQMDVETDPSLIAGVLIRAGDTVIDGSIRGRLARLTEAICK